MPVLSLKSRGRRRAGLAAIGALALAGGLLPSVASAAADEDPRVGLSAGLHDAGTAIKNLELLSESPKAGLLTGTNSDLAFTGDYAISGNYNGFNVYNVSDPANPVLESQFYCPGSQNDVSVFGDLLFMSVESTAGKIDCTTGGVTAANRFRGVRVFDISDINNPVQLPGVQTCRGSHTHTVVEDPSDPANIYIYNSGTAGVRAATELAGCVNMSTTGGVPVTEGDPAQWRIDVIKVPLAAPETAAIVTQPRIFQNYETGAYNGLQNGPTQPQHPSGVNYSPSPNTNTCHDITAYPEIGLAAGACQGNGILIDITDPANPVRTDAVSDVNFAYWHSATFNNDGTKVIFTDEWGGGGQPRCTSNDRPEWGANALFDIVDGKMQFASYYKLPAAQTLQENCVAHNGSLIPVPGRDIMVQAWYQGGTSVFDFTDTANPVEIAFFDRGPVSAASLVSGGYWSSYWYNGHIYGNEIARGFDSFDLTPSEFMSANEIAAAKEISFDEVNVQGQVRYDHAPSFNVVRAYVDQAERAGTLSGDALVQVRKSVDQAEHLLSNTNANKRAVQAQFDNASKKAGANAGLKAALADFRASL